MNSLPELAKALRQGADVLDRIDTPEPPTAPDPTVRRLLPYADAATYLGVSKRTVSALAASGEIARVEIGRRVLFDIVDLDEYVERVK